jgi:glycosyltransferase involved in cell wall biosynthesis
MALLTKLLLIAGGATILDATVSSVNSDKVLASLDEPAPYNVSGPKVSVIIPTLEEEEYLPPLLTSIQHQTYTPIETVISDSSPPESKEATRIIASSYSNVRMVDSPKLNVARGRNIGAAAASGEVLVFCDADIILSHTFIERLVEALQRGAILSHGNQVDESGWLNMTNPIRWHLKPNNYTTGRGVAIKREHFFSLPTGGFDEACDPKEGCREDLKIGADVERSFGPGSVRLVRDALVWHSSRRPLFESTLWEKRGWRRGRTIDSGWSPGR